MSWRARLVEDRCPQLSEGRQHWTQPHVLEGQLVILSTVCVVAISGREVGAGRTEMGGKPWNLESDTSQFLHRGLCQTVWPNPHRTMQRPKLQRHLRKTWLKRAAPRSPIHRAMACGVFGGAALTYLEDKRGFCGTRPSEPSNLVEGDRHARGCTSRKNPCA